MVGKQWDCETTKGDKDIIGQRIKASFDLVHSSLSPVSQGYNNTLPQTSSTFLSIHLPSTYPHHQRNFSQLHPPLVFPIMCTFDRLIYLCGCHKGGAFTHCTPTPPARCPGVSTRNVHEDREYNLHTAGPTELDSFCDVHAPFCALMEVAAAAREAHQAALEHRRANEVLEQRVIAAQRAMEDRAVEARPRIEDAVRGVVEAQWEAREAVMEAVDASQALAEVMVRKGRVTR